MQRLGNVPKSFGDHLAIPKGYWRLFGKWPKDIGDIFSNAYRVTDTLWEMLKNSWDPVSTFSTRTPANRKQVGLWPTMSPDISGIFCLFPRSKAALRNLKKLEKAEKFENYQWFFSYFYSFRPYPLLANNKKLVQQSLYIMSFNVRWMNIFSV